jgi:TfoX/Sxy family transcriptional regulator of competence genes
MNMEKSPPEMIEFFSRVAPTGPDVEQKLVFGFPTCFVNENMFMGLFGNGIFLRLSEEKRQEFLQKEGAHLFEPMPGRPMKQYVVLTKEVLDDSVQLAGWIEESLAYARALPPKEKRPKAKKK